MKQLGSSAWKYSIASLWTNTASGRTSRIASMASKFARQRWLLPIRLAQQALDVVAGATVEDCDRGSAGFPAQSVGVPKPVCVRGRLSGLSHGMPLAGRLPLPWVWRRRQLSAGHPRPAAVSGVPAPDLGDGRHRLGPHAAAL